MFIFEGCKRSDAAEFAYLYYPLTLTLSLGEREQQGLALVISCIPGIAG